MHHVRHNVAHQNAKRRHAERLRRLDVFQLAQLQRFAAQQPAQPGPAGHAEDQAQEQQAQVGAFRRGFKPVRVHFDIYLHHQHRRRDQQHARNRAQHGVQILDRIVHPAAQITRRDAQQQRERQHHQRGHRADHQPGAYAFQREVKHVLPHFVGAQHMVGGAQVGSDTDQCTKQQYGNRDRAARRAAGHAGQRCAE